MTDTPTLDFAQLPEDTDGNEALVNSGWRRIEATLGGKWIDRDLATPPGSPSEGDTYVVAASGTGDWSGHDDDIAWLEGGVWKFFTPYEGLGGFLLDEDQRIVWDGSQWVAPDEYSTSERWTGDTWIDGKKIYRKVVDIGTLPNATSKATAHGISSFSTIVSAQGICTNGTIHAHIPYCTAGADDNIAMFVNATNIVVITESGSYASYTGKIVLLYTKT